MLVSYYSIQIDKFILPGIDYVVATEIITRSQRKNTCVCGIFN